MRPHREQALEELKNHINVTAAAPGFGLPLFMPMKTGVLCEKVNVPE